MVKTNVQKRGCSVSAVRVGAWTGPVCAMASAAIYGLNPLIAKNAYAGGSNETSLTCFASLLIVPILAVVMLFLRLPLFPARRLVKATLIAGALNALTTLLLFGSYNYTDTGIATAVHFTYPALTALGAVLFYRQKLTVRKLAAILVSLTGIVLAADFSGSANVTGILMAFISGMAYAGFILLMDHSGLKRENYFAVCLHMSVIKGVICLIFGLLFGKLALHVTATAWGFTAVLGITSGVIASILFQLGVRFSGGCSAALFSMLEPVTSLAVGFMFMGETMTVMKILGCLMILAGIFLATERQEA